MRGSWLVLLCFASCGCAPKSTGDELRALVGRSSSLGCRPDYNPLNRYPAACALPAAEAIAWSCALHDTITAPGYQSPDVDEEGTSKGGTPLPEYRVENLQCRFTTSAHNAAACTFDVENLVEKTGARGRTAVFTHELAEDNGPTHHMRWLTWRTADRCIPLAP